MHSRVSSGVAQRWWTTTLIKRERICRLQLSPDSDLGLNGPQLRYSKRSPCSQLIAETSCGQRHPGSDINCAGAVVRRSTADNHQPTARGQAGIDQPRRRRQCGKPRGKRARDYLLPTLLPTPAGPVAGVVARLLDGGASPRPSSKVARLAASGISNPEMASRLLISQEHREDAPLKYLLQAPCRQPDRACPCRRGALSRRPSPLCTT